MTVTRSDRRGRALFHWKPLGSKAWTLGVYTWGRPSATRFSNAMIYKRGLVFRLGPFGHVQIQRYKVTNPHSGRVPRSTLMLSWWGTTNRRAKRYLEVSVGR